MYSFLFIAILLSFIKSKEFIKTHNQTLSSLISFTAQLEELSIQLNQDETNTSHFNSNSSNKIDQINLIENIDLKYISEQRKILQEPSSLSSYDITNRLILEQSLQLDPIINKYEFLYFKPIAKHDCGIFTHILIITAINDTLYFHDVHKTLIFQFKLNFTIGEILTYKQLDESDLYLLNSERSIIYKYTLLNQKYESALHNKTSNEKVTIRTFKDSPNKEIQERDNRIYDLTYSYQNSLRKIGFDLQFKMMFLLENNTNDTQNYNINDSIETIHTLLNKGLKSIHFNTRNGHIYKIRGVNFDIILHKKLTNEQLPFASSTFILFMNYYSYLINNHSIYIRSFDTELSTQCTMIPFNKELSSSTEAKISNYYFDSLYHILFIILTDGSLYYSFPNIFGQRQASCDVHYLFKINLPMIKQYQLSILRKDLIISNEYNQFAFVNYEEVEWSDPNSFNNFKVKYVALPNNEGTLPSTVKIIRTSLQHYFIIRSKDNEILLYHIPNVNGKIKGNEEIGFNFKVPVIFIALVVIFIVNYYKNKQGNDESSESFRGEVLNELKKFNSKLNKPKSKKE